MKKYRISRKILNPQEANEKIQNCFQAISVNIDNINYWRTKIGKPLKFIDIFILGVDKIKSPEEFIEISLEEIEKLRFKIYEDYGRFTDVKNTCA